MSELIPETYFLSEIHDPQYANMIHILEMENSGAIVRYEGQKDGAVWLKVYKEREGAEG
ncbi:MAG: hypothetical protein RR514_07790 [Christensenella sp.]